MRNKTFKGKTCAYCAVEGISDTADHVVARQFFLESQRSNLPQVPACQICNVRKSSLEHYLATVMPFGNQSQNALLILQDKVPTRLAKNKKLYDSLVEGVSEGWRIYPDGILKKEMHLPLDGEKVVDLCKMIAQGLCYYHWNLHLPSESCDIEAGYLTFDGERFVEQLLSMNAANRVKQTFGGGAFEYEGVQAFGCPEITIWRMSLYGVAVEDDDQMPPVRATNVYVSTALKGKSLPLEA